MRLLLLCLVCLLGSAWADQDVGALLCDVNGRVHVQIDGQWKPLSILDGLEVGEIVRLSENSTAHLSSVEKGAQAILKGPCRVRVTPGGFILVEGERSSLELRTAAQRRGRRAPVRLNLDQLGGLIRPEQTPGARWTTDAIVPHNQVKLSWEAPECCSEFEVSLWDESSGEQVYSERTQKRALEIETLTPGTSYRVLFQASGSHQTRWEGSLETLTLDELESLARVGEDVPSQVARLTHQVKLGLYTPAQATLERLLLARPSDPNLLELRKRLKGIRDRRGL